MVKKVILFIEGKCWDMMLNTIRLLENIGQIKVCGFTSRKDIYSKLDGYIFVKAQSLKNISFDYIIMEADNKEDFYDMKHFIVYPFGNECYQVGKSPSF